MKREVTYLQQRILADSPSQLRSEGQHPDPPSQLHTRITAKGGRAGAGVSSRSGTYFQWFKGVVESVRGSESMQLSQMTLSEGQKRLYMSEIALRLSLRCVTHPPGSTFAMLFWEEMHIAGAGGRATTQFLVQRVVEGGCRGLRPCWGSKRTRKLRNRNFAAPFARGTVQFRCSGAHRWDFWKTLR
jgi:hypothetical protein